MPLQNLLVINHPAQTRIFQALNSVEAFINQLAHTLPDIPKPSPYRHVHKMLDAGVLQIALVRYVNGIEERFCSAVEGLSDPAEVSKDDRKSKHKFNRSFQCPKTSILLWPTKGKTLGGAMRWGLSSPC